MKSGWALVAAVACSNGSTPPKAEGPARPAVEAQAAANLDGSERTAPTAESNAGAAALPTACDRVDVIELAQTDRPRVELDGEHAGAIVLVPRDLATRAPAESQALQAVAEVIAHDGLTPATRTQLRAVAEATLFPALRSYQAAHDQRVVGSFVVIDTFVLVLDASGVVTAMLDGADEAAVAACASERAAEVARLEAQRRDLARARKQAEERRPKARSRCTENPLAAGC